MTDTTKAQILAVARKAVHTEMLTLKNVKRLWATSSPRPWR